MLQKLSFSSSGHSKNSNENSNLNKANDHVVDTNNSGRAKKKASSSSSAATSATTTTSSSSSSTTTTTVKTIKVHHSHHHHQNHNHHHHHASDEDFNNNNNNASGSSDYNGNHPHRHPPHHHNRHPHRHLPHHHYRNYGNSNEYENFNNLSQSNSDLLFISASAAASRKTSTNTNTFAINAIQNTSKKNKKTKSINNLLYINDNQDDNTFLTTPTTSTSTATTIINTNHNPGIKSLNNRDHLKLNDKNKDELNSFHHHFKPATTNTISTSATSNKNSTNKIKHKQEKVSRDRLLEASYANTNSSTSTSGSSNNRTTTTITITKANSNQLASCYTHSPVTLATNNCLLLERHSSRNRFDSSTSSLRTASSSAPRSSNSSSSSSSASLKQRPTEQSHVLYLNLEEVEKFKQKSSSPRYLKANASSDSSDRQCKEVVYSNYLESSYPAPAPYIVENNSEAALLSPCLTTTVTTTYSPLSPNNESISTLSSLVSPSYQSSSEPNPKSSSCRAESRERGRPFNDSNLGKIIEKEKRNEEEKDVKTQQKMEAAKQQDAAAYKQQQQQQQQTQHTTTYKTSLIVPFNENKMSPSLQLADNCSNCGHHRPVAQPNLARQELVIENANNLTTIHMHNKSMSQSPTNTSPSLSPSSSTSNSTTENIRRNDIDYSSDHLKTPGSFHKSSSSSSSSPRHEDRNDSPSLFPVSLRRQAKMNQFESPNGSLAEERVFSVKNLSATVSSSPSSSPTLSSSSSSSADILQSTQQPKIITFNAALIEQKNLLRKSKVVSNSNLNLSGDQSESNSQVSSPSRPNIPTGPSGNRTGAKTKPPNSNLLKSVDQLQISSELESTNSINNSASNLANLFIVSRQGTVRGSVNHVKSSVKHLFKDPAAILSANGNSSSQVQLNINNNNNVSFKTSISHAKSTNPVPKPIANTNATSSAVVSANSITKKPNEKINYTYLARNYEEEEHQKIVIYTTTLQIVRLSFDKCKRVKKILQNHCVRYEERDLYKNKEFQKELKYRLNINIVDVPHIFFSGKHIGNCDQLELYSDQGLLNKLFKDLEKIKLRIYCCKCGGYRFVLCTLCNGSKKIFNNFTNLKCTTCNEDGLIRCDSCLDQQE